MPAHEVVVVGATGFIGGHVYEELANQGVSVYGFARKANPARHIRSGDMTQSETFASALEGTSTVVHTASYLGDDVSLSQKINVEGTRHLLHACAKANVKRVIYVSTTSVYGYGPHRQLRVGGAMPAPASVRSRHRAEAEEAVLAAGGCVLRPNLVYGRGDRWVVPGIVTLASAAGGLPHNGKALLSVISVRELANAIGRLCQVDFKNIAGKVFHATQLEPLSARQIAGTAINITRGHELLPEKLHAADIWPVARSLGYSEHQYDLINTDHWYDPGEFWELAKLEPAAGLELADDEKSWYRELLANSIRRSLP